MNKKSSLIEIHSAVLLFGLAGLFGKWITLSPFLIVLGRVFFASLTLFIIIRVSGRSLKISPHINYFYLILMGLLLAIHWVTFFQSIKISTVSIGLLSFSAYPVFTALLEPILTREKFIKANLLFALLCVFGVYLIIPSFSLKNTGFTGVLWGLFSGLTFALLTIMNRRFSQTYSSPVIAFFQDFFAMIWLLPCLFFIKADINKKNLILLAILGIICTAGSHTLFIKSMKFIKAQTASIIHALEPVYGIIFAFILLREIPSFRTLTGGAIILIAQVFILVQLRKLKQT